MPSSTLDRGSLSWGYRLAALWAGLLAGPVAWACLLEANYIMSYVACEQRHTWMLHVATAIALGLVAMGALAAWRAAPPPASIDEPSLDPDRTAAVRARFMALGALTLCGFFALAIAASEIPVLVLNPCHW